MFALQHPTNQAMSIPTDQNHLAQLAHAFVTSELKLEGDVAAHSFFIPLLFPFVNHPLGDDLVFLALIYLHSFANHGSASQTPLCKVPGSLLFIIALLKAFERDEAYLISPDVQALKTGIFRFIHSRPELIDTIDAFSNGECKPSLGTKLRSILSSPSWKRSPNCSVSAHHSLLTPRTKDVAPPAYETQARLVAPQESAEFSDVDTLVSRGMGGRHTVPALAYDEPWAPGALKIKAYSRGEVLDRMSDEFDRVVGTSEEEPTEAFAKRFKDELMRKYRA